MDVTVYCRLREIAYLNWMNRDAPMRRTVWGADVMDKPRMARQINFENSKARPRLANTSARKLFLHSHALSGVPTGRSAPTNLQALIERLGFVQVDSVNTVARAHDMILWSRQQSFRPKHLSRLLERDRSLFEHWTHDASIIPMAYFPHWQLKFQRDGKRLASQWRNWRRDEFEGKTDNVLARIAEHGPVTSADVGEGENRSSGGWWDWHPSKTALEYLWRKGELAVTRREGFRKVYDLTENVVPVEYLKARPEPEETVDWACNAALDRLGFATSGELAAFWNLVTPIEAKAWCISETEQGRLIELDLELADNARPRRVLMRPDVLGTLDALQEPSNKVRILSPFDPMLRDRKRTERLFGFHYRIEIFVPAEKRKFGYYVFPVLEGDRLIGRIDMKCNRADQQLHVAAFWSEPGISPGTTRRKKLEAELHRVARFTDCRNIQFAEDWLKPARTK